jgi:hypothetical protein
MKVHQDAPRVRYATLTNDDTGEITALYLYTHEAIDDEIDRRVRIDKLAGCPDFERHRVTRAKFHALLDMDAGRPIEAETRAAYNLASRTKKRKTIAASA